MTTRCTLNFGRGQELKPLFLLIYKYVSRPFSHILGNCTNLTTFIINDRLTNDSLVESCQILQKPIFKNVVACNAYPIYTVVVR